MRATRSSRRFRPELDVLCARIAPSDIPPIQPPDPPPPPPTDPSTTIDTNAISFIQPPTSPTITSTTTP